MAVSKILSDADMQAIAEMSATLISCGGDGSCSVITLASEDGGGIDLSGELTKRCFVVVDTRRATVRNEVLWIDCHFINDDALRSEFFNSLVGRIQPLVVGVEKLRFVRDEATDRLIVIPASLANHGFGVRLGMSAIVILCQRLRKIRPNRNE
jgi:hypothetical protein